MLIDFTVENYRSIKESVTLSAAAQRGRAAKALSHGSRRVVPDHEIAPAHPIEGRDIELLPVLAL